MQQTMAKLTDPNISPMKHGDTMGSQHEKENRIGLMPIKWSSDNARVATQRRGRLTNAGAAAVAATRRAEADAGGAPGRRSRYPQGPGQRVMQNQLDASFT